MSFIPLTFATNFNFFDMKFNWGTGIVVAILAFILFIVYFLVKATTDKTYNHELVTEDYYKKEIEYQKTINKEEKTRKENMQVAIFYEKGKGIILTFPEKTTQKQVHGNVILYRPSNEKLDFTLPISLQNNKMHIADEKLVAGRWNINIEYIVDNQEYTTSFKIEY
ncbi:cytochrome Cbb3 oxidase maturation protein CcoH [Capnocytophaga catalasegens]|uniref:Cytochrome Cbb3 oxidase maturation protein CcoH n=2 Tax=Capnocytophaga catalasegens TaxID=1004260 RepID=A0AAV5AVY7_9FLAO|nr:cytochrome Cbb3 oxidase maturation protein CcoH [Capnocytophaga catalasegens]GJM51416.1 cytochrome Cbb3 oxidase maturation protein CcoH [Capnocytophaga catalasegens]GJM52873.1 cytochrome Cbb3 oxidase maturation protein CcoH [Capnocytophaga catalasegens]